MTVCLVNTANDFLASGWSLTAPSGHRRPRAGCFSFRSGITGIATLSLSLGGHNRIDQFLQVCGPLTQPTDLPHGLVALVQQQDVPIAAL